MATLSSPGIGSGLDVNSLVNQLIGAERAPTDNRLNRDQSIARTQISAFGMLSSVLSGLQTALDAFKDIGADPSRKTTVADGAGFTASALTTARLGTYGVRVEKLASAQKLQSAAVVSTTQVGYGRLTIQVGTDPAVNVDIAQGQGTLANIRDAINAATGSQGVGASIVHGTAGDVLVLTSSRTGASSALTITTSGGDGKLSVLTTGTGGTMTQVTAASDAEVWVDGVQRISASNHLTDLIDGVTLDLTKAQTGLSFNLTIAADPSSLHTRVDAFVKAYNSAIGTLRTQSAAGGKDSMAGPLSGDATPRAIIQALRSAMGIDYANMATLGLTTAVDGTLTLDGTKLDATLATDPGAVRRSFGDSATYATKLRGTLTAYTGDTGVIASRTTALNASLKRIDDQRAALDRRMALLDADYRRQFTALDSMMAQMQSTSSFLAKQLG
ncbi:MAG: flagellar filament capping protein FliD [Lysobacter sp.]|nr:flagellar filament capping protein FliD [Lysobacter sp.]